MEPSNLELGLKRYEFSKIKYEKDKWNISLRIIFGNCNNGNGVEIFGEDLGCT